MVKSRFAFILIFLLCVYLSFDLKNKKATNIDNNTNRFIRPDQELNTLNISIWTLLTDNVGYAYSAVKLIRSIKNHTTYKLKNFFVMEIREKPLSDEIKKNLSEAGWTIKTVNRIAPRDEAGTVARFRDQFTKLELLNIVEYEANIYFDSDTFVIGNLDKFLNLYKKFETGQKIGVTRDIRGGVWQKTFNMGVFIIKPNRTEFGYLMSLKNDENFLFETTMSEQGFLNVAYKNQWFEIGFEHNANLAIYSDKPDYWSSREEDIKIIHFTMAKPWECGGAYEKICLLWKNF